MALPASDNFNRANEDPITTNWTVVTGLGTGALRIVSNEIQVDSTGSRRGTAYWDADSFNNDQWSQIDSVATGSNCTTATAVRIQAGSDDNYNWGQIASSNVQRVYKIVSGVITQVGSNYTNTVSIPDTFKLEISGTTLTPYWNGVAQATQSDAGLSSGSAGMHLYRYSTQTPKLDNWSGGNMAAASGPANLKSFNGLAKASIKNIMNLAIASVKSVDGLA